MKMIPYRFCFFGIDSFQQYRQRTKIVYPLTWLRPHHRNRGWLPNPLRSELRTRKLAANRPGFYSWQKGLSCVKADEEPHNHPDYMKLPLFLILGASALFSSAAPALAELNA